MNIQSITIKNVKGIRDLNISEAIYANRPNILVAPNGFGKSSIAIAFNSIKSKGLELKQEDMVDGDETLRPSISLKLSDGRVLSATKTDNSITDFFSVFVINSQLLPVAKAQRFGRVVTARASMDITPTVIYKTIPKKILFNYNLQSQRRAFGPSGKILLDISALFSNSLFLEKVEKRINFHALSLKTFNNRIDAIKNRINALSKLSSTEIKKAISDRNLFDLNQDDFRNLAILIRNEMEYDNDIDALLSAWQYLSLRKSMKDFRKALEYQKYKENKQVLDNTLDDLNPVKDRFKIKSKESKNSLVVEWPKAHMISSGQRDIMVFIAKLMECRFQSKTNPILLVIDEFFDYLDDANVVAFQYYISSLIDDLKKEKRIIFPILLTHLDPNYLKHFCFNNKRLNVCYLKPVHCKTSNEMRNFVNNRNNGTIREDLDKYFFHYHPDDNIDISEKLKALSLNSDWGRPTAFKKKIDRECRKYLLEPEKRFDPIAVCFSVRLRIEELIYSKLKSDEEKKQFLETSGGTNNKLDFAHDHGICIPETYHLLGIIYNHSLHPTNSENDLSKPLGMKLDNFAIKSMIRSLWVINNQ